MPAVQKWQGSGLLEICILITKKVHFVSQSNRGQFHVNSTHEGIGERLQRFTVAYYTDVYENKGFLSSEWTLQVNE